MSAGAIVYSPSQSRKSTARATTFAAPPKHGFRMSLRLLLGDGNMYGHAAMRKDNIYDGAARG
jgi:hypothetical protein